MDQPDQTTFVSNWIEIFAPCHLWCLSVTCSLGGQNGSLLPLSSGTFQKSWTMMANVFISFPLQSFIPVNVDRLFIKYSTSYCMCLQHAHIGCWGLDCDKTERASEYFRSARTSLSVTLSTRWGTLQKEGVELLLCGLSWASGETSEAEHTVQCMLATMSHSSAALLMV